MDLPHQFHHHAVKRRRLNEDPGSWAKQTGAQIEHPHLQLSTSAIHQANSDPRLTSSTTRQAFLAQEPCDLPVQTCLNTLSFEFETISTRPDFNGQSSSQAFQLNDTHSLPRDDTYEIQPTAAWHQPGTCSHASSTHSWPMNIPTPPPSWLHRTAHPQLVQAHSLMFVPTVASLQAPSSSQQFSEPPSVKTLQTFIPDNEVGIHVFDDSARSSSVQLDNDQSEMVCFGMVSTSTVHRKTVYAEYPQVTAISARCEQQSSREISSPFPVQIDSVDRFSMKDRPEVHGRILPEHGQMIQGLLDEQALDLHVSCTLDSEPAARKSSRSFVQLSCVLDITVYGPLNLFEEIGTWFQEYEVYLQDPQVCHLNVRYSNPQRLSSDDLDSCPLVSEVVSQTSRLAHLQDVTERPDLLDILSSYVELEESPQPAVIRAVLKR